MASTNFVGTVSNLIQLRNGGLEASHFRDVSPECVECVYQLFESGLTPSTARHQYLQDIRVSCKEGLNFHKKKAVTHQWCHEEEILITCTHVHNFAKRHWGVGGGGGFDVLKTCGKSSCSLRKRILKQPQVTKYPGQIYEGDNIPLTIAIATPLMKCVHEKHRTRSSDMPVNFFIWTTRSSYVFLYYLLTF